MNSTTWSGKRRLRCNIKQFDNNSPHFHGQVVLLTCQKVLHGRWSSTKAAAAYLPDDCVNTCLFLLNDRRLSGVFADLAEKKNRQHNSSRGTYGTLLTSIVNGFNVIDPRRAKFVGALLLRPDDIRWWGLRGTTFNWRFLRLLLLVIERSVPGRFAWFESRGC
jgi:hypothetical protein